MLCRLFRKLSTQLKLRQHISDCLNRFYKNKNFDLKDLIMYTEISWLIEENFLNVSLFYYDK
jgi:hypothetical protein